MREHRLPSSDGIVTFVADYLAAGVETGPPVVCLHGLTRNHKDFSDIIEPLQRLGRRVIALDVRGRGRSDRDPNPSNYNPLVYVQDLMGIMASLMIPRAVFIGTSMGGLMTMILASFAPHMIAGAVLNDIGPEIDPAGLKRIQGYVGVAMPKVANWEQAGMMLSAVGASTYPGRDQAFWVDFAQRNGVESPDGIIFDYDPAIAQVAGTPSDGPIPTMWDQFAAFKDIPTAVIRGALSDLLSTDIVARMKLMKADLITAEVPNVGHAPMLNETEAWRAIEAIIRVAR
jgi:pimeloyl-ACP methyl ester carboxylesterase